MKDNIKVYLKVAAGVLGTLTCIPVVYGIVVSGKVYNPLSYLIWSILASIGTIVMFRAGKGGWMYLFGYILADIVIFSTSICNGSKMEIRGEEIFLIILVFIAASFWLYSEVIKNERPAVLASITAIILAGWPLMRDWIKNPNMVDFVSVWVYIIVALISYVGEESTFNGRVIPVVSIVYWLIILVPAYVSKLAR